MSATTPEPIEQPVHTRPWWAPLTIVAFVALVICTNIANIVWADWAMDRPAGLLALSSRQRYLVLTVADGGIGVVPYAVIATVRIATAFAVCYLAGWAFRDDIRRVFTRYLGQTKEGLDAFERGLAKAEIVIVPIFVGSNIVAALTGVKRTNPVRLAVLLAIGIAGRLVLMWWLAKTFEDPLRSFLRWVDRYDRWVILASIAIVLAVNLRNYRRGADQ
jgi:hypothetical protein